MCRKSYRPIFYSFQPMQQVLLFPFTEIEKVRYSPLYFSSLVGDVSVCLSLLGLTIYKYRQLQDRPTHLLWLASLFSPLFCPPPQVIYLCRQLVFHHFKTNKNPQVDRYFICLLIEDYSCVFGTELNSLYVEFKLTSIL